MTSTAVRRAVHPGALAPSHQDRRGVPQLGWLLAAVVLAATAVVGVTPLLSPPPPAADPGAGVVDRAQQDLAVVAAAPHPMGTAEQAAVEAYLVRQVTDMGLQPQVDVQTVTMAPDAPNSVWTGTVRNIVARVEGAGPDADQAVLLLSPLVALYFLLAARFELMLAVATPLPMTWVVLALTLVAPMVLVPRHRVGWRPAAVAGAVALALVGVGAAVSASGNGPRPDLLVYHADADAGTARWVALPRQLDDYTGQVADAGWTATDFQASPFHQPGRKTAASTVPAPPMPAGTPGPPEVTVTRDVTTSHGRELTLDVRPPSDSYALTIDARSGEGVQAVAVDGRTVPQATTGAPLSVRIVAFSPRGTLPVEVTVPPGADLELALTSYTRGLGDSPAAPVTPRPTSLTTAVHEVPDAVLVSTVTRLPDRGGG